MELFSLSILMSYIFFKILINFHTNLSCEALGPKSVQPTTKETKYALV